MNYLLILYISLSLIVLMVLNLWWIKVVPKRRGNLAIMYGRFNDVANVEFADELAPPIREVSHQNANKENKTGPLLTVLLLGLFVTVLNQTLINVALPHMMNDFNVSASTIQWLVTGYMLVNGVLIPISAFLIEKYSTKKLFISAMTFFAVGSLVCGLSFSYATILIGRLIQAVGAGILMPLTMNIFLTIFPAEQRGKAMGMMGVAMMFAPAIGPTLSGWIVQNYSWRILFFITLPIAVIDIFLAFSMMKDVMKNTNPFFDMWGAILSTFGFGGLLYGFSEAGNDGWGSATVVSWMAIGSISLILFIWRQASLDSPLLEFRVFRYGVFTLTTVISSILNMAMYGAMILLPIYLQNIRGFSPLDSGLLLLPGSIVMGIMTPIAGMVFDRFGARILGVIGLGITTVTTWEFSKLTMDTTYNTILFLYIMRMFGMSLLMMTIMTAGLNQLPRNLYSHGTAMSNTIRQVAASLGTAFLVTIMTTRSTIHTVNMASDVSATNQVLSENFQAIGKGIASSAGLPMEAGQEIGTQAVYGLALQQSTVEGINDAFIVAALLAFIGFVLAFFIKRVKVSLPAKEGNQ